MWNRAYVKQTGILKVASLHVHRSISCLFHALGAKGLNRARSHTDGDSGYSILAYISKVNIEWSLVSQFI